MFIPKHKIKTAVVLVMALGIGIGVPLISRFQPQDLQAAIPQNQLQNQQITPSANQSLQLAEPAVTCSASPTAVHVNEQITWSSQLHNISSSGLSYTWSGAVAGSTPGVNKTYSVAGTYNATVTVNSFSIPGGQKVGTCSVTVLPAQNLNNQQGPPTLSCSANPPAVYAGDPVTWSFSTTNIPNPNAVLNSFIWTGAVTGAGRDLTSTYTMPATYSATVKINTLEIPNLQATCSVNVLEKPGQNSNNNQQQYVPPADSGANANTGTGQQTVTPPQPEDLSPAPEIISCKAINSTIILSEGQISIMRCYLKPPATVTSWIIKGDYVPPKDPDISSIVKTLVYQKTYYDQTLSVNWNGIDSYDNQVPDGDYTFLVSARKTGITKPDISIQKIHVLGTRPPQTLQTQVATQQIQQPALQPAAPPVPPKPPEPSKCPGLNYPADVESHWAKDFIRQAYDNCIFKGYPDGTFRPDKPISRVESVKAALVSAGIPPKLGCYDADCGTPFLDLSTWQGQWIRAAWDKKIVKGITGTLFFPGGETTRGQAVVLIARAFGIPPHKNCYTANCGAGYPNNFFLDINDQELGSYLRAMWDLGLLRGTGPNMFNPNRLITRAEMAALLVKTAIKLGKINATPSAGNQPTVQIPSTQQTGTQQ